MPVSIRTRFEVFKRDNFACRYCGQRSPDVILEVDHVVPVCEGGSDDPMNLATSCWACNHGKAGKPLDCVMTGEDPHDRAVLIMETSRQLREYETVANRDLNERTAIAADLEKQWMELTNKPYRLPGREFVWIVNTLKWCPSINILEAMMDAVSRGKTSGLRYTMAIVRDQRARGEIVEVE